MDLALSLVLPRLADEEVTCVAWCGSSDLRQRALEELKYRPKFKWKSIGKMCAGCKKTPRLKKTRRKEEPRCCADCQSKYGWEYKTVAADTHSLGSITKRLHDLDGMETRLVPNPCGFGGGSLLLRKSQAECLGMQYNAVAPLSNQKSSQGSRISKIRSFATRIERLNHPDLVEERRAASLVESTLGERLKKDHHLHA